MFRSSYKIATVLGIPIRVHISLLILLPFLARDFGLLMGALILVGLFTSIALHELGHSVVAIHKGCRVQDILLMPIGGAARMDRIPTRPMDEFQMAIAGPAVSLVLGCAGIFGGRWLTSMGFSYAGGVIFLLGVVNCFLVGFNLLPSFPMDGGRVLRALLSPRMGRLKATFIAARLGRIMAVLFGLYGLFAVPTRWTLVAIAVFIFIAAGNEYRMVQMEDLAKQRRRYGGWPPPYPPPLPDWAPTEFEADTDDRVIVSPPPYAKGPASETELHEERDDNPFARFFRR